MLTVLADLRGRGLKLTAEGARLIVEAAPASLLTEELRATIRAHKLAILYELAIESRPKPKFPPWSRPRYVDRWWRRRKSALNARVGGRSCVD